MKSILDVVMIALDFYIYIIIASAIFSWLFAFNVINSSNQFVGMIGNFLYQMTEPLFSRVRRFLPNLGTIDISPIIVLFAIFFLQSLITRYGYPNVF